MHRILPLISLGLVLAVTFTSAASAATPQQTVKQLRAQLASVTKSRNTLKATVARDKSAYQLEVQLLALATNDAAGTHTALTAMTSDRDAQAAALSTANATVGALQGQVAAQAQGGAASVIAGGPNAMWAAVVAIWQAFPVLPPSGFCGYDKDNSTLGGTGLNIMHFTFTDYTNC
jgi:hypothetical protein